MENCNHKFYLFFILDTNAKHDSCVHDSFSWVKTSPTDLNEPQCLLIGCVNRFSAIHYELTAVVPTVELTLWPIDQLTHDQLDPVHPTVHGHADPHYKHLTGWRLWQNECSSIMAIDGSAGHKRQPVTLMTNPRSCDPSDRRSTDRLLAVTYAARCDRQTDELRHAQL